MAQDEIELMADAGANAVLCPAGNLKTKSGIAPIREYIDAGVNLGLGCDNCSCGDAQNMFQAMKLLCGLAAVSDPEPGPPSAADAMRTATLGGARAAGLDGAVGAIRPGMLADISILDLGSLALVPLNSAARQLVFAEGGAAVETVIVAGRIVVQDRRLTTIDEAALRQAVDEVMPAVRADLEAVNARIAEIGPGLLDAWRRSWREDIGFDRYAGDRGK
jgi:cytosine/adenosine deaminase-related metal-dependent hydrolase